MALNTCELWSKGIKITSFSKKWKKLSCSWGLRLQRPPSVMRLTDASLLKTSPKLHFWGRFKSSPYCKNLAMRLHTGHGFWSSNPRYLCPTKNSSFENLRWRHSMWFVVWAPLNQKSWLCLCPGKSQLAWNKEVQCILMLIIFENVREYYRISITSYFDKLQFLF